MKKHIKSHHDTAENRRLFKCDFCDYSNVELGNVWQHRSSNHKNSDASNSMIPNDLAIDMITEQNAEIFREIETLKKHIKGALVDFADVLEKHLNKMETEIKASVAEEKHVEDTHTQNKNVAEISEVLFSNVSKVSKQQSSITTSKVDSKTCIAWVGEDVSRVLDVGKLEKLC